MAIQQFHCPHCAGLFQVDDDWAGQEVECPLCTGLVIVPAADVAPPELGHDAPPPPPDMLPMGTAVGYDAPPELPPHTLPIGAVPMGSVPMGALPTGEIPMGSVPVGSIPIGAVPMGSMPTGSMPVGSLPIGEVPMGTLPIDLPPPPPLGFDVPPELPAGSMPLGTPLPPDLPADVPAVTAVDLLPPTAPVESPADLRSPTDRLPPTAPTMGTSKPAASATRSSSSSRAPSDQPKPRPTHQRPQRIEMPPSAPEFVSPLPDPMASVSPAPITPPAPSTVVPVLPTTAPVPGVPGAAALDPMAPLGSITQPLEKPADEPQRDPGEIVDTRQKVKLVGTGVQQRELRKLSPAEKARRNKSRTIVTLIFCITILLLTMVFVMWREAIEKRDAEKGTEMLLRAVEYYPRG